MGIVAARKVDNAEDNRSELFDLVGNADLRFVFETALPEEKLSVVDLAVQTLQGLVRLGSCVLGSLDLCDEVEVEYHAPDQQEDERQQKRVDRAVAHRRLEVPLVLRPGQLQLTRPLPLLKGRLLRQLLEHLSLYHRKHALVLEQHRHVSLLIGLHGVDWHVATDIELRQPHHD